MKVLVTGSQGFIGRNLIEALANIDGLTILTHTRHDSERELLKKLETTDFIFHLAGVNRNNSNSEFVKVNVELTRTIVDYLNLLRRKIPIVFTSSIQSGSETIYGRTKSEAESILLNYAKDTGARVRIYKLPNVFGKWSKPDYNSAIATFCYRVVNNLPINVPDPIASLRLVYIDDVVKTFARDLEINAANNAFGVVKPEFDTTVGEVLRSIRNFKDSLEASNQLEQKSELIHNLYLTYLTYLSF